MKSQTAAAASLIRAELKAAFPGIIFSVRSDNKGSSSVRVSWIDGPLTSAVAEITGKYKMGHFDGMVDCYDYSNCRSDIPQVKFCFENREMSEPVKTAILENICKNFGIAELNNKTALEVFSAYPDAVIYRKFCEVDFSKCNGVSFPSIVAAAILAARDEAEYARYHSEPASAPVSETPSEASIAKARAERIQAEQAAELSEYITPAPKNLDELAEQIRALHWKNCPGCKVAGEMACSRCRISQEIIILISEYQTRVSQEPSVSILGPRIVCQNGIEETSALCLMR